jgi:hypothetical protein
VRSVVSVAPLRLLGRVSYGVYLFHWPVFLWLTPGRTELSGVALFALRLGVTFSLAAVSYVVVEQPVRRGALPGWRAPALLPPVAFGVGIVLIAATVPPPPPTRLVAAAAAPAPAVAVAPVVPLVRDATPADPLRVLLVGDSVAFDAAPGIEAALEATGEAQVANRNVAGFGLFQPYKWREAWPQQLRETRADLVIAMWGGWDDPWYGQHGRVAYEAVLDEAMGVLRSTGAQVLFLGEPVSTDRNGVEAARDTLPILRAMPGRLAGVWFAESDAWIAPGGRFSAYLPGPNGPERVRKVDNTHICPAGSARFGQGLLDYLTPRYGLASPDPSWRSGPWALDPRFDDPHGACPA